MEHDRTEIASLQQVNRSTIVHEINRNQGTSSYRPSQADQQASDWFKKPRRRMCIQWDELDLHSHL